LTKDVTLKLITNLRLTGHRLSVFGLVVLLSCLTALGASGAAAKPTKHKSLTQAQKLKRALKACKKRPKKKRAACVRRAKHKYAKRRPAKSLTGPVTPPAGSGAPAGPTVADLQALEDAKGLPGDGQPVKNLMVLDRGAPQRGTGTPATAGGNGQATDVWIYPVHLSYDWSGPLYDAYGNTYTNTTHERERDNVLRYPSGQFALRFQGSSETCDPTPTACTSSTGSGA
jgi:hypothetical protein